MRPFNRNYAQKTKFMTTNNFTANIKNIDEEVDSIQHLTNMNYLECVISDGKK